MNIIMDAARRAVRSPAAWGCAAIVLVALTARLAPGPRIIDDAFITFRYARNLVAGSGFVYNAGEAVLGTTTPLYALLMAGLAPLWALLSGNGLAASVNAPFAELALVVNALADAATCLLLVWLGKRAGARWAGWAAALVWAVAPFSVTFAIGGLETSLYVLLLTACTAAALSSHRTTAAALAGLALLTRPDALILLGPLGLERLYAAFFARARQKIHWSEAAAFGLPVLAWGLYATLTFGSPIANSLLAKSVAYHLQPGDSLIRLIQHYATPFLEQNLLGAPVAIAIGIVLYPTLYVIGARLAWKAAPRLLPWLLYPWLYLATFAIPNPLIFRWYLTPPLPAYFLVILIGLEGALSRILRLNQKLHFSWKNIVILAIIFILPLAPTLSDWRLHPDHGADRPAPEMAFIKLELLYRQAAARIAPLMDEHTLLAAGDVGVLGFYTPAHILDTVGLNSPVSSRYYPLPPADYVINYAIPAQLILDQQPDFVVILEVYGRNTLLKDAHFLQEYHLLEKIDTDMYGSDGMLIFKR